MQITTNYQKFSTRRPFELNLPLKYFHNPNYNVQALHHHLDIDPGRHKLGNIRYSTKNEGDIKLNHQDCT